MTAKELAQALGKCNPDLEVIVISDGDNPIAGDGSTTKAVFEIANSQNDDLDGVFIRVD